MQPPLSPTWHVYVGETDVGSWVIDIETRSAVGETSRANVLLRKESATEASINYFAPVRIIAEYQGVEHSQFMGVVEMVSVGPDAIRMACEGALKLRDRLVNAFARERVTAPETVWTLARSVGYPDNLLAIDSLDVIQAEEIEVAIPIHGVQLDQELQFGRVSMTKFDSVRWATENWNVNAPTQAFMETSCYASIRIHEALLYNA
jgi:hypothetical protein